MLQRSSPTFRRWVGYWLAWTAAGLFYISQDFMTRLSRNESIPWRSVGIGWMAAMYICAAFTPLILWLGRRWSVDQARSWRPIALHLGSSIAFSLISTALEVPLLIALEMPGFVRTMSFAR